MAQDKSKVGLFDLLSTRRISHPSSITEAKFISERQLEVRVEGYPWWMESAAATEHKSIEFLFSELTHGVFYLEDFETGYDEALEDFGLVNSSELEWAQSDATEIYCSAPLPDALGFYAMVEDYLSGQGALFDARYFLNFVSSKKLAKFKSITESNSYFLARAPKVLSDLICEELDRQGVKYRKSPSVLEKTGKYHVRLGETQFFCESAIACFSE